MTLDPRQLFRDQFARGWNDIVSSRQFETAVVASMTAMAMELPPPNNESEAAANHYRMDGARRFMNIFRNLVESQTTTETAKAPRLNYKV